MCANATNEENGICQGNVTTSKQGIAYKDIQSASKKCACRCVQRQAVRG